MEPLATSQVQAYLFDPNSAQYEDKGMAGIAIVGQPGSPGTYRLGCYIGSDYLCTADITNNNDTGIQWSIIGTGYASFRDDQQRIWSVSFQGGDPEAFQFSASIAVSMYGASNQPEGSVICCDVTSGKRERIVVPNDKVKARYCSWVVQRRDGAITTACPKLGSQLETNEHDESAYIYAAPLNHNNVTSDMKGFEGMTIGMAEESRRFIIVPKAARRGSGPAVHVCYMVYIVKKKDNAADEVEQWRSMQNKDGNNNNNNSAQNNNSSNQNGQNGPITVVVQSGNDKKKNNNNKNAGALVVRDSNNDEDDNNSHNNNDEDYDSEDSSSTGRRRRRGDSRKKTNNNNNNSSSSMSAQAPGFNFEQMDVINRMRDQVANLLMQIKETTSRVDLFSHDMRQSIEKSRPKSLSTAQMTHTMDTMLEEADTLKQTLEERDKTLRQLEDKNKDLQGKVDAFSATATRLSEEKKLAMAETSQVKIDGDQKSISLQSELTRIMSEREDTSRHLTSVKRLLEISDADCKKEKQGLQTAEVQMTTVEAKMSSADEQLQEERGRRKLLESKITTLGDELRSVLEEIRVKESQIDERRRKMEADKLHYTQIMDEERNRAADEMRELRDELVQEITVRDRRYQEERARVARESFERGRVQGIEDGHNEAAMEVDARMQMLVLEAQRYRSELETIKVRLHQSHETAEASRRHQESHCAALGRVVDELQSQVHASEVELRALESTRVTAQAAASDAISNAIKNLTRPVSRSDLLGVMHSLRTNAPLDTAFEADREKEERQRANDDHDAVVAWVKRRVVAPIVSAEQKEQQNFEAPPPLRTPWTEDVLPEQFQPKRAAGSPTSADGPQAEFLADGTLNMMNPAASAGPAMPQYVQEVERRQRELLQALHSNDPSLELIAPPKPPTPEPEPEPEPEEEEEVKEEEQEQQQKEEHVDPNEEEWDEDEKAKLPAPKQQQQQQQDDTTSSEKDEEDSDLENAENQQEIPVQKQEQEEQDEEEEKEDDEGYGYGSNVDFSDPGLKQEQKQEEDEEAEQENDEEYAAEEEEWAAEEEEEEEEEEAPVAPVVNNKKQAAAPASRQRALFAAGDSDDETDEDSQPAFGRGKAASAAVPAPAAKKQQQQAPAAKKSAAATHKLFGAGGDSDDDSSDDEVSKPVFRVAASSKNQPPAGKQQQQAQPPAAKPAPKKKSLFAETDSDDDSDAGGFVPPPRKQPVAAPAKQAAVGKKMPAPKKSLFAASDSDDD